MQDPLLQFDRMDELSQKGKAFFFLISFSQDEIIIVEQDNIVNSNLFFDFPKLNKTAIKNTAKKQIILNVDYESIEQYAVGFNKVMHHLKRGDSYLVNYTRKNKIHTNLTLKEIFYLSEAKYKVLYQDQFVCFSPETFIKIEGDQISTFPMKGTIDASIPNAKEVLMNNVKEKAEHFTVVDLLRNDLSIVSDSVKVIQFQRMDTIRSKQRALYALSSEISGIIKAKYRNKIGSIMKNLLPAGSILGAPKNKTNQIILEAEGFNRGFYTGVCGYYDGENLDSAVMIRFIENENGQLYYKSGGGITHKSILQDEYQEMINKIYVPIY